VWPPHRPTVGLLQYLVECNLDAKSVQLIDDFLRALVSQHAKLPQPALECLESSQVKRKKMNFVIVLKRAQLATRDNPDAESITSFTRGGNSGNAVVIGERQRREIAALGRFNDTLRRKCSVGRSRVCMQVDERRPARIRAHCS